MASGNSKSGNSKSGLDKLGRPVVVVTGLGVVTSLGAGKTDNWAKLTAGESGIRAITRFATDGLKTRIAGTIDFLGPQTSSAALSERFADLAADEAIAESGLGGKGAFPGPLFLAGLELWLGARTDQALRERSEEHTSELQSRIRISYAVFCLKKKTLISRMEGSGGNT